MAICPRCNQRLTPIQRPEGVSFQCPKCKGCAIGLPVLRKVVPSALVHELWLRARQDEAPAGADCAVCRQPMVEVPVPTKNGTMALDVCTTCQFVWFDAKELEQLPSARREPSLRERLPEKAREQIALMELKSLKDRESEVGLDEEAPEEEWKWIPAILGLPVEMDADPARSWPWLTWGLVAAMVCTVALTAGNLHAIVDEFGLGPAECLRHGGMTFVTSFFLHAGFYHLLGNAYFLLIFGNHVEDDLGRGRYLWLIAAAALAGDLLHIVADPRSTIPCIGASGGISGVIAFYAMRYPHARLGFVLRYWYVARWVYMPAWAAMVLWLALQAALAYAQMKGVGDVSALAHLGGVAVGLGVWMVWRIGSVPANDGGEAEMR